LSLAFFESVVWPHFIKGNNNLRKCMIICDSKGFRRAVSEAGALRSVTNDYMAVTAPTNVSFHPKVWIMIGQNEAALLVGSGNLTQSGFIDNAELFDAVHFTKDGIRNSAAEDVVGFLQNLRGMWPVASHRPMLITDVLDEMQAAMRHVTDSLETTNPDEEIHFLSSFDGPFAEQLALYTESCDTMLVASPYFGASVSGLSLLQEAVDPAMTKVFPAIHPDGGIDIPLSALQALPRTSAGLLNMANGNSFAHLKLYGFLKKNGPSWLFNGSVNCTSAALSGQNIEAGILRQVPSAVLERYFIATDSDLRAGLTDLGHLGSDERWFTCWAVNLGDSIELTAAPHSLKIAPLREVTITVRNGFKVDQLQCGSLFSGVKAERFSWPRFPHIKPSAGNPSLLEIKGQTNEGQPISGACFIDDFVALSSEPQQRAAWRAVLSLLGAEGVPEHFELSCVYNLLSEVLDSEESDATGGQIHGADRKSEDPCPEADGKNLIPIWPPVSLNHFVPHGSAGSSLNKLYWFQRILSALLARSDSDRSEHTDDGEGNDDDVPRKQQTDALSEKLRRECQKVVNSILADFESMERKLKPLVVNAKVAHKVWPFALAGLLFALGIRKAVSKQSKKEVEIPTLSELFLRFTSMMLADREQSPDFCVPAACRYRNEVFPPLAEDFFLEYKVKPHHDLALILLAIFCYLRALDEERQSKVFPLNRWILFCRILGDELPAIFEIEAVENFYRRYVLEDYDEVAWHRMPKAFDSLQNSDGTEHPGYRDLKILSELQTITPESRNLSSHLQRSLGIYFRRKKLGHQCFYRVEGFVPHCTAAGCSKSGIKSPRMQFLRHKLPVICEACGAVLVPALIYDLFKENG